MRAVGVLWLLAMGALVAVANAVSLGEWSAGLRPFPLEGLLWAPFFLLFIVVSITRIVKGDL